MVQVQLDEAIEDFLTYISSEKGLALNTIEAYRRDVKSFVGYMQSLSINYANELQQSHLIDYLSYLHAKGYASSSIGRALMALKVLFRFLKREGHIPVNIALYLDSPKLWQLIPEVLTGEEVERLLAQPDPNEEGGSRNRAILELLYGCGLRVSEMCRLGIYDVDDAYVRVLGKGGKERLVPIGQKAIAAVDHYLTHYRGQYDSQRNQALFVTASGKRIDRISTWKMIKEYGKQASIQKNISPHTLRHSFATHLLDNGADLRIIQEMLGHANISSTDRYTHISRRHLQDTFHTCHPRN